VIGAGGLGVPELLEPEPPQADKANTLAIVNHRTKTDEAETREALRVKLTGYPTIKWIGTRQ
jgi:hypothetical protein